MIVGCSRTPAGNPHRLRVWWIAPRGCSCESVAAYSRRPPTWVLTSSERSRRVSPRTTPATRRPSPTVGDNVGDCAGMAADLFPELRSNPRRIDHSRRGMPRAASERPGRSVIGLMSPLAARAVGVLASIVGLSRSEAKEGETPRSSRSTVGSSWPGASRHRCRRPAVVYAGTMATTTPTSAALDTACLRQVAFGLVLAQVVSRLTEYFTADCTTLPQGDRRSHLDGSRHDDAQWYCERLGKPGAGESRWCHATRWRHRHGRRNDLATFSLVALAAMGMLATTGVIV